MIPETDRNTQRPHPRVVRARLGQLRRHEHDTGEQRATLFTPDGWPYRVALLLVILAGIGLAGALAFGLFTHPELAR